LQQRCQFIRLVEWRRVPESWNPHAGIGVCLVAAIGNRQFAGDVPIMRTMPEHDQRIANMTFASVYPHYVAKVEKKGRTVDELNQVICWLTGYDANDLQRLVNSKATFREFFAGAKLNPHASLITGVICGYRIEEIETPLTQQTRYMDKLVDELAKGRKMEKILRTP
jgi:hypothetical protein